MAGPSNNDTSRPPAQEAAAPRDPRRMGLRGQLSLFLLASFALLAALQTWHYTQDRNGDIEAAKTRLLAEAQLIAARQEVLVERGDAILNGMMLNPARRRPTAMRSWPSCCCASPTMCKWA